MADEDVPLAARRLMLRPPDEGFQLRRDVEFMGADGAPIAVDLYLPSGVSPAPVIIIAVGYPGRASQAAAGSFKDMAFVRDWAAWFAASGMAVVTYANRQPADDLRALLMHIAAAGGGWGLDGTRIGLFAQSGNVPVALSMLTRDRAVRVTCAAFTCGFTLDVPGATSVADAAKAFGFANPSAGLTLDDLDPSVASLLVRAGQDQFAGLNGTIDAFVAGVLARNLPVSLVNLPAAPHAFDLVDDSRASRDAIRQVVAFMRANLTA
jgi:dienelactone hydrolase